MTTPYRTLDDRTLVAPQITLDSLAGFADAGVVIVISHRPDDEEPGQPSANEMAAAAEAAGMRFVHAPVTGLPDATAVTATAKVLADLAPEDRVLMFCRSGTRSTVTWALAMRALDRAAPDELREAAANAGYDLSRLPL
ncbi:TIGR01244 family sulfur transferase [Brevundimonas sp.]|uniref:TIGR01244 family sulfur transferase n=1 Tax=Brevundimonas sp. TaxID=1871086 RepID=UPI002604BFC5|nr:TIGR01244 family sulfur transferase [Brevundimonas sp.]